MIDSLYIHIPFCEQICTYCDFHKELAKQAKKQDYINALTKELIHYKNKLQELKTIYIGGGTPSNIDLKLLEELFKTLKDILPISINEYTIECNPNDITESFVKLLEKYHINRVSMGVQTFNESQLKNLNRSHKNHHVFKAVKLLKKKGITNINIDLIFDLPNQTMKDLKSDLELFLSLDVPHISYYALILEENSILYYLKNKKNISVNSEEDVHLMYNIIVDFLTKNGYKHYEISNFSKEGFASQHNITYWKNKDYLGVGSGAHSKVNGERFNRISNVTRYIKTISKHDFSVCETYPYYPLADTCMLGLRLIEGVDYNDINETYNTDIFKHFPKLNDLIDKGLLTITKNRLHLTKHGLLFGNEVFEVFLED
ncbi:MAG: radical SAM family heme chaperone HemW [Candidatus Izimaplasma sp.]|nr:radical SAM family heme chaperone HemW [Candidatus Izimaplasma bacterium]